MGARILKVGGEQYRRYSYGISELNTGVQQGFLETQIGLLTVNPKSLIRDKKNTNQRCLGVLTLGTENELLNKPV